jgi:16S rRNA processing protein RimM
VESGQAAVGQVVLSQVVLGKIVGVFGVEGWFKVESYTEPAANILKYKQWLVRKGGIEQILVPLQGRSTLKGVQVRLEGIQDRTAAEKWLIQWKGAEIAIDRKQLPAAPKGQYYWADLIGLQAFSVANERLGTIVEIVEMPAHPVMVIRTEYKLKDQDTDEVWVPLVPQRLKAVDLEKGTATVDWELDW